MLQLVLPKVMVATGVMKTLIPLHLPKLGTPIQNNGLHWRKETLGNMDATGSVSAGKVAWWRFSTDFPYYPMKMGLWQILQNCANYNPFALSSLFITFITQRVLSDFRTQYLYVDLV